LGLALAAVVLMLATAKTNPSHQALWHDLEGLPLPPRAVVQVCPERLREDYSVVAGMQRYFLAALTSQGGQSYVLAEKDAACVLPPTCKDVIREDALRFRMWQCSVALPQK